MCVCVCYNVDEVFWASKMNFTNSRVKYILSNSRECEDEVFRALFQSRINEHNLIAIGEGGRDSLCQPFSVEPGPITACVLQRSGSSSNK